MKSTQLVTIHDHKAVTTSSIIAQHFGKNHSDVLRVVQRIAGQCPVNFSLSNFAESSYLNAQGKTQPAYELTRDAFTLVAMSFTGEKALQFKLAYITAFNQMEAALRKQGQAQLHASLDQVHQHEDQLQAQVTSLKDELLDTLRSQVKLLGKPQRKRTVNRPVTADDMEQMRTLAAGGMNTQDIAAKLGRSRATVFYALRGAMALNATTSAQAPLFAEGA